MSHYQGRIIDMHTHFFPEKVFESIWEWFGKRLWGVRYKDTPDGLAEILRGFGVERFVTYNYAHREGMAAGLNEWTAGFAQEHPEAIPFGTVMPGDDGNLAMLEDLFDRGFFGIKIQPLVSDFYPCDERMFEVYQLLLERGKVLAVHAGTAPIANQYVGAGHFEPVMERFPELKVVVAHMGAYELDRFFGMVRTYPNLYLDTAVSFIAPAVVAEQVARGRFPPLPIPHEFDPEVLLEFSERILFGTDYPHFPYEYEDCMDGILALDLGEEFERKVFHENARGLLSLD
ncbi:MAG: amidohydrolase family protein [Actinobacteria bacterium]|nr:amidohydrolase family protein [Actinomycetota bacterium]MBU1943410.1 amidohydrolase family protein [Actinomycetota bacterium]MBU2686767.1 amidohydrolase family protein [Actinomycetota bacterium]